MKYRSLPGKWVLYWERMANFNNMEPGGHTMDSATRHALRGLATHPGPKKTFQQLKLCLM